MRALDTLDPSEVGDRLRLARESANLTQKEVAEKVEIARTTLVAIEKGERRVRFSELEVLASLYGNSVNALLRAESIHVDLVARFRKLANTASTAESAAAQMLNNLAKAEVELENLLGIKRRRCYPPERPLVPGDLFLQAEQHAQELRQRLGLGFSPIPDIVSLLEFELDIRVYVRRIDSKISGLFAFDDALGPCILLNANHPRERRAQSAAHECGHFVSTRNEPEILCANDTETSREERFATAFGLAFLAPAQGMLQKFHDITAGSKTLTRRHVIVMSHFFGLSREATVRRLEALRLVKPGTWDWFQANGGITQEQVQQVLGDLRGPDEKKTDADRPTTLRLNLLAAEAYRRELLSEGQLSRLLCLDRIELRSILANIDTEGDEAHGAPKLLS